MSSYHVVFPVTNFVYNVIECAKSGVWLGNPQPNVTWYYGGQLLENSEDFKQSYEDGNATLIISEIYPDDEGTYICKAINTVGEDSCQCKLTVIGIYYYLSIKKIYSRYGNKNR